MRPIARVEKLNDEQINQIMDDLDDNGIKFTQSRRGDLYVDIPRIEISDQKRFELQINQSTAVYRIPENLESCDLFINCSETKSEVVDKSGQVVRSEAHIACGLNGGRFTAYYSPKNGTTASPQGYCNIRESAVHIIATSDSMVRIFRKDLEQDGKFVWLEDELIYSGPAAFLPSRAAMFARAVQGAMNKIRCYRCHHLHYMNPPSLGQEVKGAAEVAAAS